MMKGLFVIAVISVLGGAAQADGGFVVAGYESDLANYVYATLPKDSMPDITICFWFNMPSEKFTGRRSIISYATTEQSDEISVWYQWSPHPGFDVTIRGLPMGLYLDEDVMEQLVGWNRYCAVNDYVGDTGYYFGLYTSPSEKSPFIPLYSNLPLLFNNPPSGGGTVSLFKKQECPRGCFDEEENGVGYISWFNWWDIALSLDEMNALQCSDKGDVMSLELMDVQGAPFEHQEDAPCALQSPACTASGSTFALVPGTDCTQYTQNGQGPFNCGEDLQFNVDPYVCTCDWSDNVECTV